jgi:hypothetical protein
MNNSQTHTYRHWLLPIRVVLLALALASIAFLIRPAAAANLGEVTTPAVSSGWTPLQFAVWSPVQVFDENRDVYGLRTSLFYGRNRDIYGIDLSLFANSADDIYGLSILVFGNELLFACNFGGWTFGQQRVPNIHGIQIGGGAGAGFILYPLPIFAVAGLVTKAGNVDGAQISLIGNHANKVRGLQIAGLGNYADKVGGIQIAVLGNYAESDMTGLQLAVIGSKAKGIGKVFQIAVLGNETDGDYGGFQLGLGGSKNFGDYTGLSLGLVHNTYGHMRGYQMSVLLNIAGQLDGAQTSAIFNMVRGDGEGLQLGAINISDRMKGVQLGAINYSRQFTGIQIGGMNIITEGMLPFMIGINVGMTF